MYSFSSPPGDRLPAEVYPRDNRDALREEFVDHQVLTDLPPSTKTADGRLDTFWGGMGRLSQAGEVRFPRLSALMKVLLVVRATRAVSGSSRRCGRSARPSAPSWDGTPCVRCRVSNGTRTVVRRTFSRVARCCVQLSQPLAPTTVRRAHSHTHGS